MEYVRLTVNHLGKVTHSPVFLRQADAQITLLHSLLNNLILRMRVKPLDVQRRRLTGVKQRPREDVSKVELFLRLHKYRDSI